MAGFPKADVQGAARLRPVLAENQNSCFGAWHGEKRTLIDGVASGSYHSAQLAPTGPNLKRARGGGRTSSGEVTPSCGSAGDRPFPLQTLWATVGLRAPMGRDAECAEWAPKRLDRPTSPATRPHRRRHLGRVRERGRRRALRYRLVPLAS